jgi:hypothetical protein
MKKFIYISLLILVFGVSSCDDELTIAPSYELNEVNGITNTLKARAAVDGIYPFIVQGSYFSGGLCFDLVSRSGVAKYYSDQYNMDQSEEKYAWLAYYEAINAANYAISGVTKLGEETTPEEEKVPLVAEARFLKAFAQMYAFWRFGHFWESNDESPYGVLYRDELSTVDNLQMGRLTVGESYARIHEDLDYAIANLPNFSARGNRYVSKEFAKVFKAKVLLYRHGYRDGRNDIELTEALGLVNEVLNAEISGFAMQGDLAQVYQDSWDSPENLFSGYLEQDGDLNIWSASSLYTYSGQTKQTRITSTTNADTPEKLTAGLINGAENWFQEDARWPIVTGISPYAYNGTTDRPYFVFQKVHRLGKYWGQLAGDNKYNTYFFRYPELYILKAELLARTGASYTDAIAPINEMRSKRTNPVFESLNPQNEQEAMDMIFKEYALETILENGSTFYASLRFKNQEGLLWIEGLKGFPLVDNKVCCAIPEVELLVNKVIEQNPDYESL